VALSSPEGPVGSSCRISTRPVEVFGRGISSDKRRGYVALADLADVLGTSTYRIIGGHMVTALVARWQLGAELYRETGDTDVGVPPVVVRKEGVIGRLIERGYARVEGNRFARPIDDVPVTVRGAEGLHSAVIDVLVPSYRTRARSNHRVSDDLVTTEVPGLALALQREPILLHMELHRLNGERLDIEVAFPDEVAALTLKAFASQVRDKATDIVDLWPVSRSPTPRERMRRRSPKARPLKLPASFASCSIDVMESGCPRS